MSESITRAAQAILKSRKELYSAPLTLVPANEADFPHLDLEAYRLDKAEMEANGFRYVADLEILEISRSSTTFLARTMIRSMISVDGSITSGYYQIKPRVWRRLKNLAKGLLNARLIDAPKNFIAGMRTRHCSDFETEFNDGSFLITSSAQSASTISLPPTIERWCFPYGTLPSVLLATHRARIEEICKNISGKNPVTIFSLADVLDMQKRLGGLKAAYKASMNWVSQEELEKLSGGNLELANEVFAEIQRLLKIE